MTTPLPLHLSEIAPGVYRTDWLVPDDASPATYDLTAVEVVRGFRLATTPSAPLVILPALPAAPPAPPRPPGRPPAPPGPPTITPLEVPEVLRARVPGRDYGWADPRETVVQTPLWVDQDDSVIVSVRTSLAGQILAITAREWQPNGEPIQAQTVIAPPADRSVHFFILGLTRGYLTSAQVIVTSAGQSPQRGECFVALRLARGSTTKQLTQQLLGMDYLTGMKAVGWPGGRVLDSVEFPGWLKQLIGGAVPAGADFNFVVPFSTRWRVRGMLAKLVTSGTVANRVVGQQVLLQGATPMRLIGTFTQTATQTLTYFWLPGLNASGKTDATGVDDFLTGDLVIHDGDFIGSKTIGLQAGDQWSGMQLVVEEVLEDTTGGSPI